MHRATPGLHAITPYLIVGGLSKLAHFLVEAFGARETFRLDRPDGSVMHLEMRIGDSLIMMGEPLEGSASMPGSLHLYVWDCDAVYWRALQAGAESVMPVTTMKNGGERCGAVLDPSGNVWWIATRFAEPVQEEPLWPDVQREPMAS